jgi:hypothetical protein
MSRTLLLLLSLLLLRFTGIAQDIKGETLDMEGKKPLTEVQIENIHTSVSVTTAADGSFSIAALSGQLLEFRRAGYKTARVRIPDGNVPPFFRIILSKSLVSVQPENAIANRYDYKADSIKNYELYKHVLEFPRLSAMEKIQHPFSAMSKRNREIWQFQDDFKEFEKEKYVDKTFNEQVINKFTGLTGDSLTAYMRRYRPSYEQLRAMNDYTFFQYIRSSAYRYRTLGRTRNPQ